jgi:hypothetical protein
MKPAPPKARALRVKLEALAARGVNGEATGAQGKLLRLLYSVAVNIGKGIRICLAPSELSQQLTNTIRGALADKTP